MPEENDNLPEEVTVPVTEGPEPSRFGSIQSWIYPVMVIAFVLVAGIIYMSQKPAQPQQEQQIVEEDTGEWKNYKNDELGFELVFTDPWKGYEVESKVLSQGFGAPTIISFVFPTIDSTYGNDTAVPLAIYAYPSSNWNDLTQASRDEVNYITRNAEYVFAYTQWEKIPSDFADKKLEIRKVVDSFKLNNAAEAGYYINLSSEGGLSGTECPRNESDFRDIVEAIKPSLRIKCVLEENVNLVLSAVRQPSTGGTFKYRSFTFSIENNNNETILGVSDLYNGQKVFSDKDRTNSKLYRIRYGAGDGVVRHTNGWLFRLDSNSQMGFKLSYNDSPKIIITKPDQIYTINLKIQNSAVAGIEMNGKTTHPLTQVKNSTPSFPDFSNIQISDDWKSVKLKYENKEYLFELK